jgi:hypothetical protein
MISANIDPECDICRLNKKIHKPATTKSINLAFAGWELCDECAEELNNTKPAYRERDSNPYQDSIGSLAEDGSLDWQQEGNTPKNA